MRGKRKRRSVGRENGQTSQLNPPQDCAESKEVKSEGEEESGSVKNTREGTTKDENELKALQIAKLKYEVRRGRRLEEIKGLLAIVTAFGVMFTIYVGLNQQWQSVAYRNDDRFDRAIARLSSHEPTERLAGLAAIQQFLYTKDAERQKTTLVYLVNAASLEGDPTVRSAIEDTFNGLSKHTFPQEVLNPSLEQARTLNLALLGHRVEAFTKIRAKSEDPLVSEHNTEIPIGDPASEENRPLQTTGEIIASLIRAGARIVDLKGIYCFYCNFSGKNIDLSGVNFDNALLRRANFHGVRLDGASFHNADLISTNFLGASLRQANLSMDNFLSGPFEIMAARETGNLRANEGAIFVCSDLQGANFSGRLLFTLILDDPISGGNQRDEFSGANLDHADFSSVRFGIAIPESALSVGPLKKVVPDSIEPVPALLLQEATGPVSYFKDERYRVWVVPADSKNELKALDHYRLDVWFSFGSLYGAKDWHQASLPGSFRSVLADYERNFKKPPVSYDCRTGLSSMEFIPTGSVGKPITSIAIRP